MLYQGPTREYIDYICKLYGDVYDDRIENCKPPSAGDDPRESGENWMPGKVAAHKSLIVFQDELAAMGLKLSSSKIRKILITGGCWSTERSREIAKLFEWYTASEWRLTADEASKRIAKELGVSLVTVNINLPYRNVVYNLENKSKNAVRCARYKNRKKFGYCFINPDLSDENIYRNIELETGGNCMFNSFKDKMRRIYKAAERMMPKDGSFTPAFIDACVNRMTDRTKERVLKTTISLDTMAHFMLEAMAEDKDRFDELLNSYMDDPDKVLEYEDRNRPSL